MLLSNVRNFWLYAFATVTNVVCSYAVLYLLTNYLTKSDYAAFGLYNSVLSLLLVLFNFGTKESVFKLVTKRDFAALTSVMGWFFRWQAYILFAVVGLGLCYFELSIIVLNFVVLSWLFVLAAYFRGSSKYTSDALCLPIQRFSWLITLVAIIYFLPGISYFHVFLSSLIATSITLSFFKGTLKTLVVKQKVSPPTIVFKYFLIEAAILLYTRVDVLLLNGLRVNELAIADYYIAVQIFDAAVLLLTPVSYFFFKQFAEHVESQRRAGMNNLMRYIFVLLLLVMVGQFIWYSTGKWFLSIFANQYLTAFDNISLFLWALYPLTINLIFSSFLILKNAEIPYAAICVIGLVGYLVLAYFLIPVFGTPGAVYSRIFTETILTVSLFVLMIWKRREMCPL